MNISKKVLAMIMTGFEPESLDYETRSLATRPSLLCPISRTMVEKIAGSGITYSHIKCVYCRDSEDGLKKLVIISK